MAISVTLDYVDSNSIYQLVSSYRVIISELTRLVDQANGSLSKSSNWKGAGGSSFHSALSNWVNESKRQISNLSTISQHLNTYATKVQHSSEALALVAKAVGLYLPSGIWNGSLVEPISLAVASLGLTDPYRGHHLAGQLDHAVTVFNQADQLLRSQLSQFLPGGLSCSAPFPSRPAPLSIESQIKSDISQNVSSGMNLVGSTISLAPSAILSHSGLRIIRKGEYVILKGARYFGEDLSPLKRWIMSMRPKGTFYKYSNPDIAQFVNPSAAIKGSLLSKLGISGLVLSLAPDIYNYSSSGKYAKVGYMSNRFVVTVTVDATESVTTTAVVATASVVSARFTGNPFPGMTMASGAMFLVDIYFNNHYRKSVINGLVGGLRRIENPGNMKAMKTMVTPITVRDPYFYGDPN